MAHREEDLGSESKTINAVVNALAEQAAHASASEESVSIRDRMSLTLICYNFDLSFLAKKKREEIFARYIFICNSYSSNKPTKSRFSPVFIKMDINTFYKIRHFRYTVWSLDRYRLVSCRDQSLRTISRAKNLREKDGESSTRATLSTRIRINDDTRFISIRRDINGSMLE